MQSVPYPVKQARRSNTGPGQPVQLLRLEILDEFLLLAKKRQQLDHRFILATDGELRGDESLDARPYGRINELLLFVEGAGSYGGDDSILALEGRLEVISREVTPVDDHIAGESSLAFRARQNGNGKLGIRNETVEDDAANAATGL